MKETSITFRLSEEEKAHIMRIATDKDVPVSQLIREAIRRYIKKDVDTSI